MEQTWENIQSNIGLDVYIVLNGKRTRAKLESAHELENNKKWATFSVYENREFTPAFFGINIGNFNSMYSPKCLRNLYGFCSEEVFKNIDLCNPQSV